MTKKLNKQDKFVEDVEFLEKAVAVIKKRAQFDNSPNMYLALSVLKSKVDRMLEQNF